MTDTCQYPTITTILLIFNIDNFFLTSRVWSSVYLCVYTVCLCVCVYVFVCLTYIEDFERSLLIIPFLDILLPFDFLTSPTLFFRSPNIYTFHPVGKINNVR